MRDDPLTDLVRMASMFTPQTIRVAATLRLPDLVAAGATHLDELAVQSGADLHALGRLMHYLVLIGIFRETGPGTYDLTDVGRVLLDEHPAQMRGWLDLDQDGRRIEERMEGAIAGLLKAVRNGKPVYHDRYGRTFWDDLAANPELAASFDGSLAAHASGFAAVVVQAFPWNSVRHVVDVGGGTGALLAELLATYPHLKGTLVDLPSTVADAEQFLAEASVLDRCELVGGSFFDPLPQGADVYVVANTVHNWSDDNAVRILRRCAEAAAHGGIVALIERILDGQSDSLLASYADLLMLVLLEGRERTVADFRDLGSRAGLRMESVTPLEYPGLSLLQYSVQDTDRPVPPWSGGEAPAPAS